MRTANKTRRRFGPHRVLLPLFFRLRNLKVLEHLAFLQESQFWPRERLEELQLAKLRRLVKHASETVPYYREVFALAGITAKDIRTLDDVKRLPILTKEDIVDRPLSAFLSSRGGRPFAVRKTSGTTGHPVTVLVDRDTYAWSIATRYRCEQWHGIGIGDRQARLWGRGHHQAAFSLQSLRELALNRRTISSNVISADGLARDAEKLVAFQPEYIYGYTSMVLALAEYLKRTHALSNALPLKAVICTAEKLHYFQKEFLRRVFECPILDEYGCSEVDIMAFDCERGRRHVIAEYVLLEVVDRDESGTGKIVVTDLNNRLMPLIRYNLGDVGSVCTDPCPCGRELPILSDIQGRTTDQYIVTPDGKRIHSVIFPHFLTDLAAQGIATTCFRVVQERPDRITFYVVPEKREDSPRIDSEISKQLIPQLGKQIKLQTQYVEHIESPGRKFSYFEPCPEAEQLWGQSKLHQG